MTVEAVAITRQLPSVPYIPGKDAPDYVATKVQPIIIDQPGLISRLSGSVMRAMPMLYMLAWFWLAVAAKLAYLHSTGDVRLWVGIGSGLAFIEASACGVMTYFRR